MKLCSNEFYNFLKQIPDNVASIEELIPHLGQNLSPFADSLHLGKMNIELSGTRHESTLYSHPEGYSEYTVSDYFSTGEHTSATITCFPVANYQWTNEEIQDIHFLIKAIYLLCERTLLTEYIRTSAITDSLTGAVNTTGLFQYLGMIKSQNNLHNYTCICINLKNFKYINQRFGSKTGDIVLTKYSLKIKSILCEDELFARLGGDNFITIIRNEHLQNFLDHSSNVPIHIELADSINTLDIIAYIGIYPMSEADSISDIMNRSTLTVMVAKNSVHHNIILFRECMLEKDFHDKEIASAFSSAINNKEFVVYYQPKIQLETQTLCGCEALVRWQKNDTLIPPIEFIQVFEREGSICLLDFYVFEKVCQDLRDWLDRGIEPVRVSVNFSKIHLHNRRLAKDILLNMKRYQIDSKYIEIELTETSGYEDFEALESFINEMNSYGIATAIDDFGTGYSSLNLIKNLDLKIIKLDKSFLHTSSEINKADEVVLKTIINMAQDLDMEVVCEGVETKQQAEFLKKLRCHMVQGFLFDKPLPHDEFEERLINQKKYQ